MIYFIHEGVRHASVFYQSPDYIAPVLLSENLISSISTLVEIRLKQYPKPYFFNNSFLIQ